MLLNKDEKTSIVLNMVIIVAMAIGFVLIVNNQFGTDAAVVVAGLAFIGVPLLMIGAVGYAYFKEELSPTIKIKRAYNKMATSLNNKYFVENVKKYILSYEGADITPIEKLSLYLNENTDALERFRKKAKEHFDKHPVAENSIVKDGGYYTPFIRTYCLEANRALSRIPASESGWSPNHHGNIKLIDEFKPGLAKFIANLKMDDDFEYRNKDVMYITYLNWAKELTGGTGFGPINKSSSRDLYGFLMDSRYKNGFMENFSNHICNLFAEDKGAFLYENMAWHHDFVRHNNWQYLGPFYEMLDEIKKVEQEEKLKEKEIENKKTIKDLLSND